MKMLGAVVGIALLTSGCVTGYRWEEPVGRYLSLARCQQDPRTMRCERSSLRTSDGGISPSVFLPGGTLSQP